MNGRTGGAAIAAVLLLAACGGGAGGGEAAAGSVQIDGSSTVFPITEAVAEEFMAETRGSVRVTVAMSGSGGGFRRFCAGETEISNASRPIDASEAAACELNGVEYVSLPIALDGLSLVVHPSNDFAQCVTMEELRRIWDPGSTISRWSEVRPEWPDLPLRLYAPGTNSGTFDYFTEEVAGEPGVSRSDFTASEDDNVLVQGVAGDPGALGYFGFAYFHENRDRVRLIGVDAGAGCVEPSLETIESGEYTPLSRPLYLYLNVASLADPAVDRFVAFYLNSAPELAGQVGYVPLSAELYSETLAALDGARNAS